MIKIILAAIVLIALGTGFAFFKYFNQPGSPTTQRPLPAPITSLSQATPSASILSPVEPEEEGISSADQPARPAGGSTEARVSTLETKLSVLQKRIEQLEGKTGTTTTTQTTTSKSPSYAFALGSSGGVTTQDWSSLSSLSVSLDPADFPGYKSFQLEVELQQFQGNGTAYGRLYNNTDKLAIFGSEVSTSSFNYTWVSSQSFSLPSSKKSYILQLKTTTGYTASANNFRIKVNY